MRILIIDDDAVVLASCRRILSEAGLDVVGAPSCSDARRRLEEQAFDLILVDIKMPEEDGLCFMDEHRRLHPDVPCLVMSGYPTPETIDRSRGMGAQGFVPKPFTPDELLEAVREAAQAKED
jgi:DNA-binding NtrC family response regulator